MLLVDTSAFVGLLNPADGRHDECVGRAEKLAGEALVTTLPVLTETFHMLRAGSRAAENLAALVQDGMFAVHLPDAEEIDRAFELMAEYADLPMDFADASLVSAAESLGATKVFTLDARDFAVYRVKRGKRRAALTIV